MSELILSLFPGLGLFDRAFEGEGFCIVRGPDVLWGGDVRTFHPPSGVFDGVIGGPPCQTFSSLANLVRAKGHEPRFGNLIPEFERCVAEAQPRWFLMENVPAAPVPEVEGYAVRDFVICNSAIAGEDGFGQEQERKRRFSFGVRGAEAPDLRRWIKPAALLLPAAGAVYAEPVNARRGVRVPAVLGDPGTGLGPRSERVPRSRQRAVDAGHQGPSGRPKDAGRSRVPAVLADQRDTPVAIGGSGKVKRTRHPAVVGGHDDPPGQRRKTSEVLRERIGTVTGGGQERLPGPELKRGGRRSLAEMCRLQGLPEDFLADAPFTMEGKRKAVANGVPLPTGRAIAAAVRRSVTTLAAALLLFLALPAAAQEPARQIPSPQPFYGYGRDIRTTDLHAGEVGRGSGPAGYVAAHSPLPAGRLEPVFWRGGASASMACSGPGAGAGDPESVEVDRALIGCYADIAGAMQQLRAAEERASQCAAEVARVESAPAVTLAESMSEAEPPADAPPEPPGILAAAWCGEARGEGSTGCDLGIAGALWSWRVSERGHRAALTGFLGAETLGGGLALCPGEWCVGGGVGVPYDGDGFRAEEWGWMIGATVSVTSLVERLRP